MSDGRRNYSQYEISSFNLLLLVLYFVISRFCLLTCYVQEYLGFGRVRFISCTEKSEGRPLQRVYYCPYLLLFSSSLSPLFFLLTTSLLTLSYSSSNTLSFHLTLHFRIISLLQTNVFSYPNLQETIEKLAREQDAAKADATSTLQELLRSLGVKDYKDITDSVRWSIVDFCCCSV